MSRLAISTATALVTALMAASAAEAHISISPTSSRPGDLQRYRLIVPNESTMPTTRVDVRLPGGVTFVLVREQAPWKAKLVRSGSEITQITWRGGQIPPDGYEELYFLARNPVRTGTAAFKALQTYADGDVVRWIGDRPSDNPAPIVRLSETATPQDVVSTHGDQPAGGVPQASASTAPSDAGTDWLSIAAIVLAGLAAVAAGGTFLRRSKQGSGI